jgi:hypothetical protein|nr:MAG TPA: ASCH domain protein [Caudoviricetes sp.]
MAIKPILFNTDMVRAIMDGRKTCTRRVVKTRRKDACGFYVTKRTDGSFTGIYEYDEDERMFENQLIPPYKPGDILYVRETWHRYTKRVGKGEGCHLEEHYGYKASIANSEDVEEPWKPSIHMPKEAARIWLKVTDVRVERLQDITDDGAKAEGANCKDGKNVGWQEKQRRTAIERFSEIWESTVSKEKIDSCSWAANPWVWVIEFERCEKMQEEHK